MDAALDVGVLILTAAILLYLGAMLGWLGWRSWRAAPGRSPGSALAFRAIGATWIAAGVLLAALPSLSYGLVGAACTAACATAGYLLSK